MKSRSESYFTVLVDAVALVVKNITFKEEIWKKNHTFRQLLLSFQAETAQKVQLSKQGF